MIFGGASFLAYPSRALNLHPEKSIEVMDKYRLIETRITNARMSNDGKENMMNVSRTEKTTGSGRRCGCFVG